MKKDKIILLVGFIVCLLLGSGYFLVDWETIDSQPISKIESHPQKISTYSIASNQNITGTLEILWDSPQVISSPVKLLSKTPFTLSLAIDVKIVQGDEVIYWYGIPTYEVMNQFGNEYSMTEPGTGLFKTIGYTLPFTNVVSGQLTEYVRPHWYVITQTNPIYLDGEVFTDSLHSAIWQGLNVNNQLIPPDGEGYFYNRVINVEWEYRVYLPVIIKFAN